MSKPSPLLYHHEVNSLMDYVVMESAQLSILRKDDKIRVVLYEFLYGNERETLHEMPVAEAIAMAKAILVALGDGS